MLKVEYKGLSDNKKFFNRSHITPALIQSGKTFTDKEIAEIYDVSLTTIRRWKKDIKARSQPNTKLCSTLPHNWTIRKDGKWEKTEYKGIFGRIEMSLPNPIELSNKIKNQE